MLRRLVALVACALALAACEVDLDVDMEVQPDGTGLLTLSATADAEVVAAVPTLADELVLDDAVAAGWEVDGPTATDDGGLAVTMSHDFVSGREATNLLNSIGPPFAQMVMARTTVNEDTTTRVEGLLGLPDGFTSFADDDLVASVGAMPFAEEIAAAGASPESSMSAVFRLQLPGEIVEETTNATSVDGNTLEWVVPMDGQILTMRAESVQSPGDDRWWARPLSIVALVALIAWVTFMVAFIGYVAIARWRRARRYKRRPRPGGEAHDRLGR